MAPAKIKCNTCNQVKSPAAFSNGQLKNLRRNLANSQFSTDRCFECSPQQKFEQKCYYCDVTKVVDKFSRREKNKNEPKWKKCMDEINKDPRSVDSDEEANGGDDEDDDGDYV
ncbi:hypothetical protein LTR37_021267 [Vermiconidia calcicola]|uniref:Uncharacterized protein n=1 Tax=Vermiconidia calcicola TaxID=1690605 RepID=A0ACC3MAD7_9PEZI|nr:hypothetical protein LTR37_021267 [Vermiconidia calcicola]